MQGITTSLKNWVPFHLKETDGNLVCEWIYLGSNNFNEPFFEETLSKCWQLQENSRLRKAVSDVSILQEWASQFPVIEPTAIVFHVSRCGSTLLSQMLAQDPANIVLSEVPFFDELLRYGFRANSMAQLMPVLKDAVAFHGVIRNEKQKHLFIKTDSWHIHFYNEWRRLYPNTPFFLLYRRPDEVLLSHQKRRGMHAVQGVIEPAVFGFDDTVFNMPMDEYLAKVLESYYQLFYNVVKSDALVFAFDYKSGMINIVQEMMGICDIGISDEQIQLMKQRSSSHGKYPRQVFSEEAITADPPKFLKNAFRAYDELNKIVCAKLLAYRNK